MNTEKGMICLTLLANTVRLTLLANTVRVFKAVHMIECARHDPPLFIEAFAGKNCAYHVGRVNNICVIKTNLLTQFLSITFKDC